MKTHGMTPQYWKDRERGKEGEEARRKRKGKGEELARAFQVSYRSFYAHRTSPHFSALGLQLPLLPLLLRTGAWEVRSLMTLGISLAHTC